MIAGVAIGKKTKCATIQGGTIVYSDTHYLAGESIETGFDIFGYNYQGHMFKGSYYKSVHSTNGA